MFLTNMLRGKFVHLLQTRKLGGDSTREPFDKDRLYVEIQLPRHMFKNLMVRSFEREDITNSARQHCAQIFSIICIKRGRQSEVYVFKRAYSGP